LNINRNLKLNDFDHKIKIKENIAILIKLFRRLLNQKDGVSINIYNKINVRTKIFAIGFGYYILLRNYELYKTEF